MDARKLPQVDTSNSVEGLAASLAVQKIKRIETADDLVGTVLFLASPAAGFMTGQCLLVDGGTAFI